MEKTEEIEGKIGYTFRDKGLLKTCFTHTSYAHEHGCESNERLEFLGDALLGFLVAEALYARGGAEGEMTSLRIRLVSAKPLAEAVRADGLDKYLLLSGAAAGERVVSSLFEALVAGIWLDGGIDPARTFVFSRLPLRGEKNFNPKGDLQEYLQAEGQPTAKYTVIGKEGKDNAPRFTVRVQAENESAVGEGGSVREAEKQAAQRLLAILKDHRGE